MGVGSLFQHTSPGDQALVVGHGCEYFTTHPFLQFQ